MHIDHFDGKPISRKSRLWLGEAINDALQKAEGCAAQEPDGRTFPAHVNMWRCLAAKYKTELDNR